MSIEFSVDQIIVLKFWCSLSVMQALGDALEHGNGISETIGFPDTVYLRQFAEAEDLGGLPGEVGEWFSELLESREEWEGADRVEFVLDDEARLSLADIDQEYY